MKIAMHNYVLWARASGSGRFLNAIQYLLGNGSATSITGPVRRPAPHIFIRSGEPQDHGNFVASRAAQFHHEDKDTKVHQAEMEP